MQTNQDSSRGHDSATRVRGGCGDSAPPMRIWEDAAGPRKLPPWSEVSPGAVRGLQDAWSRFDGARELSPKTAEVLISHGFDVDRFLHFQSSLRCRGAAALQRANVVDPNWQAIDPKDFGWDAQGAQTSSVHASASHPGGSRLWTNTTSLEPAERAELHAVGRSYIQSGRVAHVVLAGGMSTRFGEQVKALVPVGGGLHFLDLKVQDAANKASQFEGRIPVWVMASFRTEDRLLQACAAYRHARSPVRIFSQGIGVRFGDQGLLHHGEDGAPSLYAPGHGDLQEALTRTGALAQMQRDGIDIVFVSNVDNAAATIDPVLVGLHATSTCDLQVEVVERVEGEAGGAPAIVDGRPQVVEWFRFPEHAKTATLTHFNTNSLWIKRRALDAPVLLKWFLVQKQSEASKVWQFERLVGEMSDHVATNFVEVPREGEGSRFLPVKTRGELDSRRPELLHRVRESTPPSKP